MLSCQGRLWRAFSFLSDFLPLVRLPRLICEVSSSADIKNTCTLHRIFRHIPEALLSENVVQSLVQAMALWILLLKKIFYLEEDKIVTLSSSLKLPGSFRYGTCDLR